MLEIDGPDVHPDTIDSLQLLDMASAFFALVAAEAKQQHVDLNFKGLSIIDKCAAVVVQVSDDVTATWAAARTERVIRGAADPPKGAGQQVQRFRRAAQVVASHEQKVRAIGADWTLPLANPAAKPPRPMRCLTSLRATPIQISGKPPKVRFESNLEREAFTLHATMDQVFAMGKYMLHELDLEVELDRDADGNIQDGAIVAYEPVAGDDGDPWTAWEQWYREVNRED